VVGLFGFVALDGLARLVVENELPFIAIPRAFFAQSNTLSAMGDLLVALYRDSSMVNKLTKKNTGRLKPTRRLTARQLAQFLEALTRGFFSACILTDLIEQERKREKRNVKLEELGVNTYRNPPRTRG
jgi:hypothetical protein